ncbi:YhfC family intramembrane metalloprotease [Alkalibacter rhizosphaerae]|uniref:YhfC family intramembrane metalloprotease n=1 Tax=Alkalibacter rhizosphaerae TaxID=2815577 RepID=A0A974XDW9_9FIRM|nr:YhfC family glutamic-type intramembrane protease [Alkalibacter rhizosphaerae]QSX08054.1 YhfC family intramembrane metalloprotease [Alkalibacter rhizosphaerae]
MTYGGHVVAVAFAVLFSVAFPIGLLFYSRKLAGKFPWKQALAGAMVFAIFQIFTRIPLITYLQGQSWFVIHIASERLLMALFLSFTAGLFEEVGRTVAFLLFRRNGYRFGEVFAYGVGHGGFESLLLVGVNTLANLVAVLYLAFGWFSNAVIGNPQIFGSVGDLSAVFAANPAHLFFFGGLERVFAIMLHIALSFVVAKGVSGKRPKMVLMAILIHTAVNFVAVLMPGVWLAEGFLLLVALGCFWYIRKSFYTKYLDEMGDRG